MNLQKRHDIRQSPDWLVWRGEDPATGELFLVKEVNPRSPYGQRLATRLKEEFQFLDHLHSPQILRPRQLEPKGKWAWFEDAQCSLAQYVQRCGPLSPSLTANVLFHAAAGLEYLHGLKKGHGCVNPHTLFIGSGGEVLFGDFLGFELGGYAPIPDPDQETRYQAPELLGMEAGRSGPSADLYCLGYTCLELLTGDKFPTLFEVPDGINWLAWHADPVKKLEHWQEALRHVPKGLIDILAGLIAKPVHERLYESAAELKLALQRSRLTSDQRMPDFPPPLDTTLQKATASGRRTRRRKAADFLGLRSRPTLTLLASAGDNVFEPLGGPFSPGQSVLVGRSRFCDVLLPSHQVSRKHALLVCGCDGIWRVHDLRSREGVYVNGERVRKARLNPASQVQIAGHELRVVLGRLQPGTMLEQFELYDLLHQGARGSVYRATWPRKSYREVVVHVFPSDFQHNDRQIRRFMRGILQASTIHHPHLVRLYRGGVYAQGPERIWFLATEYLSGGSLRDRLGQQKPLPVAEALRVGTELADALEPMAAAGWVHRNINPGCILFDRDGSTKLGDFFFVRGSEPDPLREVTTRTAALGDIAYQPPEQVMGERTLRPTCDVYSLGATVYEALTGQSPFPADTSFPELCKSICQNSIRAPSALNPAVPPQVDQVLLRTLARAPEDRYARPQEFGRALEGIGIG